MKKNKKKELCLVLLLLLVGVTSVFVSGTYAKYISSGSASATVDVAKWAVTVNSKDITPAGTTSIGKVSLTTINSQYVVNGKIAPQSSAYGVFTIDPTGSEVALGYKFDLGTITSVMGICNGGGILDGEKTEESVCTGANGTWTADPVPTGLAIDAIKYCEGATCAADESAGTWTAINKETSGADTGKYLGTIALPNATTAMTPTQTVMIKVTVKWSDDETAGSTVEDTVDDPNHTAAGIVAPELTIPVTVTVYQKVA